MATGSNIRTYFDGTWHEGDIPVMRAADRERRRGDGPVEEHEGHRGHDGSRGRGGHDGRGGRGGGFRGRGRGRGGFRGGGGGARDSGRDRSYGGDRFSRPRDHSYRDRDGLHDGSGGSLSYGAPMRTYDDRAPKRMRYDAWP